MFSAKAEGGVGVALVLSVDKDTGKPGPDDGTIIYLHRDDGPSLDDYDSDEESITGGKAKTKATREEPEDYGESKKRKREEPDEDECVECGTPESYHNRKTGDCPSKATAMAYHRSKVESNRVGSRSGMEAKAPYPNGKGIVDSRLQTPYQAAGGRDHPAYSGREGRALSRSEHKQLESAVDDEPDFESDDPRRVSTMKRLHAIAMAEKKKKDGGKHVQLQPGSIFRCLPLSMRREVIMVVGQAGAGKSWWTGRYIRLWKEQQGRLFQQGKRKDEPKVYVLSAKISDPELDKAGVKRILLDADFTEEKLTVDDFQGQLVVFDDCDLITEKKIKKAVFELCEQILGIGRDRNIWCIRTSHFFFNWGATRTSLLEANKVVFFPARGSGKQGVEWLKKHAKLDKNQIAKIAKLKSRWVVFDMTAPNYVLSEHELALI